MATICCNQSLLCGAWFTHIAVTQDCLNDWGVVIHGAGLKSKSDSQDLLSDAEL